jgi:hypothetical protein
MQRINTHPQESVSTVIEQGPAGPLAGVPNPRFHQDAGRAATGFAQMFGLHPMMAFLAIVLDVMLFGGEIASGGVLVFFSLLAGVVFGVITFLAQRNWYGDDHAGAVIKGLIMGLLTAIPTPLPALLYAPAGVVGIYKKLRDKK